MRGSRQRRFTGTESASAVPRPPGAGKAPGRPRPAASCDLQGVRAAVRLRRAGKPCRTPVAASSAPAAEQPHVRSSTLTAMPRLSVLIVDDEKNIRHTLRVCLEAMQAEVSEAASAPAALEAIGRSVFDVVFLDLRLGTQSGLDLIPQLLAENPNVVIIVVTAYATVETAVDAIRRGAWDYLPKPFTPAQIRHLLAKAENQRSLSVRLADLEQRAARPRRPTSISGRRRPRCDRCWRLSAAPRRPTSSVLFRGESGTGKGVLARAMHLESKRARSPLRDRELPDLDRGPAGQRAVRPRQGRVHRRHPRSARPGRGGRGRHPVSRRDRRSARRPAGRSCCAFCRRSASSAWARREPARRTCASWRPPTATSRPT